MSGRQFTAKESIRREVALAPTESAAVVPATSGLVVGAAHDPAEGEADRVADAVLARLRAARGHDEHPATDGAAHERGHAHAPARRTASPVAAGPVVGREGGALDPSLSGQIEAARGAGAPLDGAVRERMEAGFGASFGDVRVHTGAGAGRLNRQLSARAFTTGSDIFFGAGEYQPHSAEGERVLAHELAHVRQGGAGARRMIRRQWDFGAANIPWDRTTKISTVSSGQLVFFLQDDSGDPLVVKSESNPIGLQTLAEHMHVSVSKVKSVKHRKLPAADGATVAGLLRDRAKLDKPAYEKLAQRARPKYDWVDGEVEQRDPTAAKPLPDFEWAAWFSQLNLEDALNRNTPFLAMTAAAGGTAADASTAPDIDATAADGVAQQETRMRRLMDNPRHQVAIGRLSAVDLFMGNGDRMLAGNMGNWFYDPTGTEMTAIDHIDGGAAANFQQDQQSQSDIREAVKKLSSANLPRTAAEIVDAVIHGMGTAGDAGAQAWLTASRHRRTAMEENIVEGLREGRKNLLKIFAATKWNSFNGNARAAKKSIKAAAKQGAATDNGVESRDYYDILKARANWLKKN